MIGSYIKFLRQKNGLSARRLSELSGLSPSYVAKLEAGQTIPTIVTFAKVCRALGCSSQEILFMLDQVD